MFSQKMKRIISILLIVAMVLCCNGFSVLATSIDDVVTDVLVSESEKETPNYYYEYLEQRKETIVVSKNLKGDGNEEDDNEGTSEVSTSGTQNENLKNDSKENFEPVSDEEDDENSSYVEEPEEDENENQNPETENSEKVDEEVETENSEVQNDESGNETTEDVEI